LGISLAPATIPNSVKKPLDLDKNEEFPKTSGHKITYPVTKKEKS